jgi:hypothetical protein
VELLKKSGTSCLLKKIRCVLDVVGGMELLELLLQICGSVKPNKKEPKEKPLVLPQVDPRIQAAGTLDITI